MTGLQRDLAGTVMALDLPGQQICTLLGCGQHQISLFPLALVLTFRIRVAKREAGGREAGDHASVAGTSLFVRVGQQG